VSPDVGSVAVNGTIAYASQEPCFFTGSVKANILFGKPFDPVWYGLVLESCALDQDLRSLAFGDESLIGDKGLNLSGGQKARISLARYEPEFGWRCDEDYCGLVRYRRPMQNLVGGLIKKKGRNRAESMLASNLGTPHRGFCTTIGSQSLSNVANSFCLRRRVT